MNEEAASRPAPEPLRVLLVGPYDPHGGEYTFLSPPLGVWRLAGGLETEGVRACVFDPNICDQAPEGEFARVLREEPWDVIGFSTTGMTLRFDLALAHQAHRQRPEAVLLAGGMEATFDPEAMFRLGPFDLVVLGEGERPLRDIVARLRAGEPLRGIPGTVRLDASGVLERIPQPALSREELRDAVFSTPYERMPYRAYWERLERAYRVGELPVKADREARLAEIRSVRLATLNYCPLGCSFCSSTNFLNSAQGSTARLARLDAGECLAMLRRIVAAFPDVRTIIFQDDIFVFTTDDRLDPLCNGILQAKADGDLPADLQFISTNRIDAMTPPRLALMRRTGFRVLGFGVENMSLNVLREFNKPRIHSYIAPMLTAALEAGITPFLDLILTSPGCSLDDLAETIRRAYSWTLAGCETGMYPYVIPFSGAPLARDPALRPHTVYALRTVGGTDVTWSQPVKILPRDPQVRAAILAIEKTFEARVSLLENEVAHLPSRMRSLLWVASAVPVLEEVGQPMPPLAEVEREVARRLPAAAADHRRAETAVREVCGAAAIV